MQLQSGQNVALTSLQLQAYISWAPEDTPLELDPSAFLLTASGKTLGDSGFVFYGQTQVEQGAVQLNASIAQFRLALDQLNPSLERVVIALTIDQGLRRQQAFKQLRHVRLEVKQSNAESLVFALDCSAMVETALILGEFYRRNGQWKFRAVGQGFVGGLGPLARHYGVEISDDPDQAAARPPLPPASPPKPDLTRPTPPAASNAAASASPPKPDLTRPTPPAASNAAASASPPKPDLTRPTPPASPPKPITLEKRQPISLAKQGNSFGEILVNLNWSRAKPRSWFGSAQAVDLDLGCMLELRSGAKDVIQALGKRFGQLHAPPYVQLMGDDRSGDSSNGEDLRINGAHWDEFKRIVIFAFIYEGVPNWAAADGVVKIRAPGQPELIVRLDSHSNHHGMCAIAALENEDGRIKVSKLVDYYDGHKALDKAHGFGFNWVAGSK